MSKARLRTAKQQVRALQARVGHFLRGYSGHFAATQVPIETIPYAHLWGQAVTSIPARPGADATLVANRLRNIELAAQRVHGLLLEPGQIFSFWNRVPRPTLSNGFREGPAFMNGEVSRDVGGGLCLVSTNLFNAFLAAGCEILERHNHSIDPYGERRFFPLGQDATVYYGYKDLIVRNSSSTSLQVRIEVQTHGVNSSLWGCLPSPWQVRIESRLVEQGTAPGPAGMPGYRTETVRLVQCSQDSSAPWRENYRAQSLYAPCAQAYYPSHPVS